MKSPAPPHDDPGRETAGATHPRRPSAPLRSRGTPHRRGPVAAVALILALVPASQAQIRPPAARDGGTIRDGVVELLRSLAPPSRSEDLFREAVDELLRPRRIAPRLPRGQDPTERDVEIAFARLRDSEIRRYREDRSFPGARPFHEVKSAIEASPVFKILRLMPKGAALHIHSSAAGRARWIVEDACSRPHCYVYWPDKDTGANGGALKGQLMFCLDDRPPPGYRLVSDVRKSVKDFDRELLRLLTLGPEELCSPDIWTEFGACFQRLGNILDYQPVFADYFADAFETLAADGVDHVELRIPESTLFDAGGRTWSSVAMVDQYLEVRDRVRAKYPGFSLKLIVAGYRGVTPVEVLWQLIQMIPMRYFRPDTVVGYDLVGEEDSGYPTTYFAGVLILAKFVYEYVLGIKLDLYLHDGESNWREDFNLRSAFGLFSRRVGHGLNLHFFPALERQFIARPVPLEICPISNQVLAYIADLRLHPAEGFLRRGVVCTISSDDPGIFGYEGTSPDFWEAVLCWRLGLGELKKLCRNSIEHSAMHRREKERALKRWEARWSRFIKDLHRSDILAAHMPRR